MAEDPTAFSFGEVARRFRWPFVAPVSGRYHWSSFGVRSRPSVAQTAQFDGDDPEAISLPTRGETDDTQGVWPLWLSSETIRLDVDGRYPQMTLSGETRSGLTGRVHWIAELSPTGFNSWQGPIWYRDGAASLMPFSEVRVTTIRSWFSHQRNVTIEFLAGTALRRTRR